MELVYEVRKIVHNMTGTEQRITSAYNPQLNGLCERQNRTIKDCFVKAHDKNRRDWLDITMEVLFAIFREKRLRRNSFLGNLLKLNSITDIFQEL